MHFPLFSYFSNLFNPPSTAEKPITFTTQADLFKKFDVTNEGLCGALSNQYAIDRIRGREPAFLRETDAFKVYENAIYVDTWQQMSSLLFGVKHAQFNAIKGSGGKITEFKGTPDKEQFAASLQKHNLISFPNRETGDVYHMIYFEKETPDQCRVFNANVQGGEQKGPCSELIQAVSDTAFRHLKPDGSNRVILGSTDAANRDDIYWLI